MAEEVKRKRGRPRKIKLPEEVEQLVQETKEKQEELNKAFENQEFSIDENTVVKACS